jgi:hypothetical protein
MGFEPTTLGSTVRKSSLQSFGINELRSGYSVEVRVIWWDSEGFTYNLRTKSKGSEKDLRLDLLGVITVGRSSSKAPAFCPGELRAEKHDPNRRVIGTD